MEKLNPQTNETLVFDFGIGLNISRDQNGVICNAEIESRSEVMILKRNDEREIIASFPERGCVLRVMKLPPPGLERERSGHPDIPPDRQMWVVDFAGPQNATCMTIPVKKTEDSPNIAFEAIENSGTRQMPFLPFELKIEHPFKSAPKDLVLMCAQIFGHLGAAIRTLKKMPEEIRRKTALAFKNTDNGPATVRHLEEMDLMHEHLVVPFTYDDATSGGENLLDRTRAVWWLVQNPELVDMAMKSKVIISDLREETAILKHLAACIRLSQIFLALTFGWPQRTDRIVDIPASIRRARENLPDTKTKLEAMEEVGLEPSDAVTNWFIWAEEWKGGVRDGHAHAVDLVIDFSLISPTKIPVSFDNCAVCPPRTGLETEPITDIWPAGKPKVFVCLGSGDWTQRKVFSKRLVEIAELAPDISFVVAGNIETEDTDIPSNMTILGFVSPSTVDCWMGGANVIVLKPGHFTLEETAGKVVLIAPPDDLDQAVDQAVATGSPRPVAIATEVIEERLAVAAEAAKAAGLGDNSDLSTLLDISGASKALTQIRKALARKDKLERRLKAIPRDGTQILINQIEWLLGFPHIHRSDIEQIVRQLKERIESNWTN